MTAVAASTTATIVARDTAILAPLFRTLYADPAICPKRVAKAASAMWTVERMASGQWLVPSSNGQDAYLVDATAKVCTCPDHQTRGARCYHALAVWLFQRWERAEADAGTPAEVDGESADYGAPLTPDGVGAYAVWQNPVNVEYMARLGKSNVWCQRCAYWGLRRMIGMPTAHALRVTPVAPTRCDECGGEVPAADPASALDPDAAIEYCLTPQALAALSAA